MQPRDAPSPWRGPPDGRIPLPVRGADAPRARAAHRLRRLVTATVRCSFTTNRTLDSTTHAVRTTHHCTGVSDDLLELISTLLTKEQRSRPAIEEVLALPVVRSRITRFENEMRRLWPMGGGGSGAPTPTPQPDVNGDVRAGAAVDAACAAAASFSLPPELSQRAPGATAAGGSPIPPPANGSMALPVAAGSVSWPLEPTPLEVSAAERELVAAAFAEADEPLLCLCAVQRVNEVCCCCVQRAVVVPSVLLLCAAQEGWRARPRRRHTPPSRPLSKTSRRARERREPSTCLLLARAALMLRLRRRRHAITSHIRAAADAARRAAAAVSRAAERLAAASA